MEVQYFNFGSIYDWISNISVLLFIFNIRVTEPFWWKLSCKTQQRGRIYLLKGFQSFDFSIDMVLNFDFGHNISILRMVIFNKVD